MSRVPSKASRASFADELQAPREPGSVFVETQQPQFHNTSDSDPHRQTSSNSTEPEQMFEKDEQLPRKFPVPTRPSDFAKTALADFATIQRWNMARSATCTVSGSMSMSNLNVNSPCIFYLRSFVRSRAFEIFFSCIIAVNAVLLGVQIDHNARTDGDALEYTRTSDFVFCILFMLELVLRIIPDSRRFFCGRERLLNIFDAILVALSLVDVLMGVFDKGTSSKNFAVLRVLRFLRYVRILRILRVLRFFKELRLMLFSIFGALRTLLWTLLLLGLLTYAYGMFLTLVVANHRHHEGHQGKEDADLAMYFGSLGDSMFTLFKATLGGMDWGDAVKPLREVSLVYMILTSAYIAFVLLALLNMVTGIFCEQALECMANDKEVQIGEEMIRYKRFEREMKVIFSEIDTNGDNLMTLNEFEDYLEDEEVRAHFRVLGINVTEAVSIFRLLDLSSKGSLEIDEFVMGCFRIKGLSKGIDFSTLLYENKRMVGGLMSELKRIDTQIKVLNANQNAATPRMNGGEVMVFTHLPGCNENGIAKPEVKGRMAL